MCSSGAGSATPALFTRPASGPAASTRWPAAVTEAGSVTSIRSTVTASGWSFRSACSSASVRTEDQTCAPARASASTQARPMPVEAPVTTYDLGLMATKYGSPATVDARAGLLTAEPPAEHHAHL